MGRNPRHLLPQMRLHKASGHARVRIDGTEHWLGRFGSKEALATYDRLIAEYLARRGARNSSPHGNGRPRPRVTINRLVKRIRGLFKWAVSMEIIPAQTWHAVMAVEGLRRGRSLAPELPPVRAVPDEVVQQTLPHLPTVVADLVQFIRLSGCRPGEACMLRPADVEKSAEVWKWTLASHKNSWSDHERVIMIGPRAQNCSCPTSRPCKASRMATASAHGRARRSGMKSAAKPASQR